VLAAGLFVGALACSKEPVSGKEIRISPPGEGNVVHFDLEPKTDAPILISSSDVQAQRNGDSLVVNFNRLVMSFNPQAKIRYAKPTGLSVQVGSRLVAGRIPSPLVSRLRSAGLFGVDKDQPRREVGPFQIDVPRAGALCDSGCVLGVVINYDDVRPATSISRASTIPGSAESAPVSINMVTGMVAKAVDTAPPTALLPAPEPVRLSCSLLSAEDASRAVGQPLRLSGAEPGSCTFNLAGDSGLIVKISTDAETGSFYQLTAATGAEMVDLGDRAVWLPSGTLHVIDKRRRLTVQMEGANPNRYRQAAEEVARAILRNS
jgi:hypothetical protein